MKTSTLKNKYWTCSSAFASSICLCSPKHSLFNVVIVFHGTTWMSKNTSKFCVPDSIQPYLQPSQLSNYSLGSIAGLHYLDCMFSKGKTAGLWFGSSGFSNDLCPGLLRLQEIFVPPFCLYTTVTIVLM